MAHALDSAFVDLKFVIGIIVLILYVDCEIYSVTKPLASKSKRKTTINRISLMIVVFTFEPGAHMFTFINIKLLIPTVHCAHIYFYYNVNHIHTNTIIRF